jgi:paraquat-inducible protein A
MRACHECDALQRTRALPRGALACCWRCGAVLQRGSTHALETTLALMVAATLMFVLANTFPIVELELQGQRQSTSLWGAVLSLWSEDMRLLATLVFTTTLLLPALDLGAMLWLLLPLARGQRPKAAPQLLRALHVARPWAMVEVFVLGALVALVKLAHLAHVVPGVALWSFGGLIVVYAAATGGFDSERAWTSLAATR